MMTLEAATASGGLSATLLLHALSQQPTFAFSSADAGGAKRWPPPLPSSSVRKKKRRRQPRRCKNEEEEESQRMTHIVVERNRRRLINDHLAALKSLMPEPYTKKGDQASIVGGAIDFIKQLEQVLQSLQAQLHHHIIQTNTAAVAAKQFHVDNNVQVSPPPFSQLLAIPGQQMLWHDAPGMDCLLPAVGDDAAAAAHVEVTVVETHASIRILTRNRPRQLLKMVAGFPSLQLTILYLNVTAMDPLILYSLSVKVEDGCTLTSVDDIATAVHNMLSLIQAESVPI